MQAKTRPEPSAAERHPHETRVADRRGRQVAGALDPRGRLHYGQDDAGGDHIIAVLGEQVPGDDLGELRHDGVSYQIALNALRAVDDVTPPQADSSTER